MTSGDALTPTRTSSPATSLYTLTRANGWLWNAGSEINPAMLTSKFVVACRVAGADDVGVIVNWLPTKMFVLIADVVTALAGDVTLLPPTSVMETVPVGVAELA